MRPMDLARLLPVSAPFVLTVVAPPSTHAQRSRAMAVQSRAASANSSASRQRAEQWVQGRLKACPGPRSPCAGGHSSFRPSR